MFEFRKLPPVVFNVSGKFPFPEDAVAGGHFEMPAIMAMPKTAVNENNRPAFFQNQVGLAGERFLMEAEPEALAEKGFADLNFRLGVLSFDP